MPKKQPKNAFFFFMLDFRRMQETAGRRFPGGMKDVAIAASDPWKSLSVREKEKYEQMAKAHKAQDKKYGEKYTSQGKPLSELYLEQEEKKRKDENQKNTVLKIIDEAVKNNSLDFTPFYVISFNYFTKEISKSRFYPAELGLVRFSIKKGITKKFHCLINPGQLPLGHAYMAKEHSDKTHKLPLPPKALGESDYLVILENMVKMFVDERSTSDEILPVFVMENEMEMVDFIFREFHEKTGIDVNIRLLPLTFFFYHLRVAVDKVFTDKETNDFSFAIAQAHLEHDIYQYYSGNGCRTHEIDDVNIHCALSRPTRWAYYIIDHTIGVIGGKKKPGFHFPKQCIIDEENYSSDDDDEEEEETKPNIKDEEVQVTKLYAETSDIKVEKYEYSDDDNETINHRINPFHRIKKEERHSQPTYDTDRESTTSSYYDRRFKEEERDRNNLHDERSYASSVASTNPFHMDNFPELGAVPKTTQSRPHQRAYQRFGLDSDSDQSSCRRSVKKEPYQKERRDSDKTASSSQPSGSRESQKNNRDPRLMIGGSNRSTEYLREKYEKLKAEIELLDKIRKKRDLSRESDRSSSGSKRSCRSTRSRSNERYDDDRAQGREDDAEVFYY